MPGLILTVMFLTFWMSDVCRSVTKPHSHICPTECDMIMGSGVNIAGLIQRRMSWCKVCFHPTNNPLTH